METRNDAADRALFHAATKVTIGDGAKASFWSSSWIDGTSLKLIAPKIFEASSKKGRCVKEALSNQNWLADILVQNFTLEHMS